MREATLNVDEVKTATVRQLCPVPAGLIVRDDGDELPVIDVTWTRDDKPEETFSGSELVPIVADDVLEFGAHGEDLYYLLHGFGDHCRRPVIRSR